MARLSSTRRRRLLTLLVLAVASGALVAGGGTALAHSAGESTHTASAGADGRIIEVYPNPTTAQNRGEYVTVDLDRPGNWTVTDGEGTARLPDRTGEFAVTRHPAETATHTNVTAVEAGGSFQLAVSGETLELRRDGRLVDRVSYEDAPESQQWHRDRDPHWQPAGFRPRDPATTGSTSVEAFVLPDAPGAPTEAIAEADRRLYLAAYTLTSERVVEELIAAHDRGAEVRVLVEGGPVGGMSTKQAARLDRLAEAGAEVHAMTGERARFRYHHAKYAVVDDRAVVLTENWKPSGTGGADNRGWGVRVDAAATADDLAAVFKHDATWNDTVRWSEFRSTVETTDQESSTGSYARNHPPLTTTADSVTVLTAPDNTDEELIELINETDDRLLIVQPSIGSADFPLLEAAMRAADRGVDVRILLGSQWYNEEENDALASRLGERTEGSDNLNIRLAEGNGRFGKIHAKGVVADDTAVVGSLNWNDNSLRNNREVALAIQDEAVADYYAEVFDGDWSSDGTREIPVGILVVTIGAAGGTVLALKRRLEFADQPNRQRS
ncbi:phospholipase D-like domain-containing protein [Halohasta litorea]|uniref:Phospholipase D-like domain-containing protein n=1 Tax=Halohasta litorea TaxID=869891 RepID=A0ABD6D3W1_9EURY|nr:phospholipase D-like domain-containing protein [Halohasta litorea]